MKQADEEPKLHPCTLEVILLGKRIPIRQYTSAVGKPSNPSPYAMSIGTHPSAVVRHRSSMGKLAAVKTQS